MSDRLRQLDAEIEQILFGRDVQWSEGAPQSRPNGAEGSEWCHVARYSDPVEGWRHVPVLLGRLWELGLEGWFVRRLLPRLASDFEHDEDADTSTLVGTVVKELLFGSVSTGEKPPEMACRAALEATKARRTL